MNSLITAFDNTIPCVYVQAYAMLNDYEASFWESLRHCLRKKGFELFLNGAVSLNSKKIDLDVPYISIPHHLDNIQPFANDAATVHIESEKLLRREEEYFGQGDNRHRSRAIEKVYFLYRSLMEGLRPVKVLVGNGNHSVDMILISILNEMKIPYTFFERGPFPKTWHIDEYGMTAGTKAALRNDTLWAMPPSTWLQKFDQYEELYRNQKETWWEQPAKNNCDIRQRFKIPEQKKIILFANQLDNDTSNFLYAPLHRTNLEAFRWLCQQIEPLKNEFFIIGKHHPMNTESKSKFEKEVNKIGVWVDDVPLEECLAISDYVAAVNSTLLYEALINRKPCLMIGQAVMSNKNIAYEVKSLNPEHTRETINAWLHREDIECRFERWGQLGASLFSDCLFTMDVQAEAIGMHGADELANTIIGNAQEILPKTHSPEVFYLLERLAVLLNPKRRISDQALMRVPTKRLIKMVSKRIYKKIVFNSKI